jgi:hypothetical protein
MMNNFKAHKTEAYHAPNSPLKRGVRGVLAVPQGGLYETFINRRRFDTSVPIHRDGHSTTGGVTRHPSLAIFSLLTSLTFFHHPSPVTSHLLTSHLSPITFIKKGAMNE